MNNEGKPLRKMALVDGLDSSISVSRQTWQTDLAHMCPTKTCLCTQSCWTTLANSMSLSPEVRPVKRHIQG